MSALRIGEFVQEIFYIRFSNGRGHIINPTLVQRSSEFLRHVRDRQAASALIESENLRLLELQGGTVAKWKFRFLACRCCAKIYFERRQISCADNSRKSATAQSGL